MGNYHESVLGFLWLESVLANDATLSSLASGGVWRSMAPPGTATPFVIMAHQAGTDVTNAFGYRLMTDQLFQVKVVAPASITSQIAQASAQVDRLLGGPPGGPAGSGVTVNSVFEGQVLDCYREQQIMLDEIVNGELWTNIGGLYRLLVQQNAS